MNDKARINVHILLGHILKDVALGAQWLQVLNTFRTSVFLFPLPLLFSFPLGFAAVACVLFNSFFLLFLLFYFICFYFVWCACVCVGGVSVGVGGGEWGEGPDEDIV